jgi:DNA-binding NarL/FixJ family response regulator
MRILLVDDDPQHVSALAGLLQAALDADVLLVDSVEDAVRVLHEGAPVQVVVTDIFIPLGPRPREVLGPRARRYAEDLRHLGGLVLLDELDRVEPPPRVLAHTACTDFELIEALGDRIHARVPKPAGAEVLLRAVVEALGLPVPG